MPSMSNSETVTPGSSVHDSSVQDPNAAAHEPGTAPPTQEAGASRVTPVTRAALPSLPAAGLALHNALRQRRASVDVTFGGDTFQVTPLAAWPVQDDLTLGLTLGDWQGTLTLPQTLAARLMQEAGLRRAPAECDADLQALWLESRLLPLIEAFEAAFQTPIELRARRADLAAQAEMALALSHGEDFHLPLRLGLPEAGAEWLAAQLTPHAPAQPVPAASLPLTLRRVVGHQTLSRAELRSLRVGDAVIVLPEDGVLIGDRLHASVVEHPSGCELSTSLTRLDGGYYMADTPADSARSAAPPPDGANDTPSDTERDGTARTASREAPSPGALDDATLDQVPVRLVFECGRADLPLGDVRQLGEGSVLPLSKSLDGVVDIVVNGRRLGRGSLVNIGDAVGVRVDQLALDD